MLDPRVHIYTDFIVILSFVGRIGKRIAASRTFYRKLGPAQKKMERLSVALSGLSNTERITLMRPRVEY